MQSKRAASLSLDLDNQWSYMKTHGDAGWEEFPSYLDLVIPRFNEVLAGLDDQKITVFTVGQDAALENNHAALRQIPEAGHEVGNHSFHHEPWLHLYSPDEIEAEVGRAEQAIQLATGVHPDGWRGPGFSFSPTLLEVLARRGYVYDASTFPSYLGPLARAYYFMTAELSEEEKTQRKQLFGKWTEGLRPIKPYDWQLAGGYDLLEIPVTTMPVFKVPFHVSYLLYLASFSKLAAELYFRSALRLCQLTGVGPSLLLHPLDFLGADDVPELGFFPAMDKGGAWKTKLVAGYLSEFKRRFDVRPMGQHARIIRSAERSLPHKSLAPAPVSA
ncbi:MAG: polysaccharide deacetylase family protein [Verrucomicrobiales bacterium]